VPFVLLLEVFLGSLSSFTAPQLGSVVKKGALDKAGVSKDEVTEVYMGNVLQAGQGQAPATQASIGAGLPTKVPTTTVNKVCASGMKSIMLGAQSLSLGHNQVVVAGGMESMSQVPFYVDARIRQGGIKYGDTKLADGIINDGLTDVYNQFHMGMCGEDCAKKHKFSRQDQDNFAIQSYKKAAQAVQSGFFANEIIAVQIKDKKGGTTAITLDEEVSKVNYEKLPTLKSAFTTDGTITAANASKLNDGASALVLTTPHYAKQHHLKPIAKIIGYADAACDPIEFPVAPALAIPLALQRAGLTKDDIDWWEINEAFSVVILANIKLLNLDANKVNPLGGAVSLGHPIGSSGARIVSTLVHHLQRTKKKYGCAAICNGGGGASAIVVQRLEY